MISFVIGLIRSGLQVMIEETVINLYNIHWLASPQEEEEPGTLQRRSSINTMLAPSTLRIMAFIQLML